MREEKKKSKKKYRIKKSMLPTDRNFHSSAVGQVTDVTTGTISIGRLLFDPMISSWLIQL